MQSFAAYLFRQDKGNTSVNMTRDLFRTLENIAMASEFRQAPSSLPKAAITWYPQTEFCYFQNPEGLFLAMKAGFNNESHNHNDVGTFSLYVNETPFFIDAGVGTYTRQTFGPERYSIWTMQSDYHNLPLINGKAQVYGASYKAINTRVDTTHLRFSTDIAGAYPKEAGISSWIRTYQLSGREVSITDQFAISKPVVANAIHFLVWEKPELISAGKIRLEKEGTTLLLQYDPRQFDYQVDSIAQTDSRLSTVWGKQVYRIRLTATKIQARGSYRLLIRKE